jgi:hypothetical protein
VEEHLQREQRLARARLACDYRQGPYGQPAAEDAVEGDASRSKGDPTRMVSRSLSFLLRREENQLSKLENLLQGMDDELAGHLDQERAELADQVSQRRRRSDGPAAPARRAGVAVREPLTLDGQFGQLRASSLRTPRGTLEQRGRRGGPEKIGQRVPKYGEESGDRELGGQREGPPVDRSPVREP